MTYEQTKSLTWAIIAARETDLHAPDEWGFFDNCDLLLISIHRYAKARAKTASSWRDIMRDIASTGIDLNA